MAVVLLSSHGGMGTDSADMDVNNGPIEAVKGVLNDISGKFGVKPALRIEGQDAHVSTSFGFAATPVAYVKSDQEGDDRDVDRELIKTINSPSDGSDGRTALPFDGARNTHTMLRDNSSSATKSVKTIDTPHAEPHCARLDATSYPELFVIANGPSNCTISAHTTRASDVCTTTPVSSSTPQEQDEIGQDILDEYVDILATDENSLASTSDGIDASIVPWTLQNTENQVSICDLYLDDKLDLSVDVDEEIGTHKWDKIMELDTLDSEPGDPDLEVVQPATLQDNLNLTLNNITETPTRRVSRRIKELVVPNQKQPQDKRRSTRRRAKLSTNDETKESGRAAVTSTTFVKANKLSTNSQHVKIDPKKIPKDINKITDHQLVNIDLPELVAALRRNGYSEKKIAELKQTRTKLKNRFSAKGSSERKRLLFQSNTATNKELVSNVKQLVAVQEKLYSKNKKLSQKLNRANVILHQFRIGNEEYRTRMEKLQAQVAVLQAVSCD